MTQTLALGYIPLVDAAPLIVAAELGFAEEEGLHLDLQPAASWSMLRSALRSRKATPYTAAAFSR